MIESNDKAIVVTPEEFKIAREWLNRRLLQDKNMLLPCKIARKKIKDGSEEAKRIKKTTDKLFEDYKYLMNFERNRNTTDGLIYSKYYVVQPMVGGITLNNYLLMNKVMSISQAVNLAVACIDAIEVFHKKDLVHGDVHAGNIILHETKGGIRVEMIDFGNTEEITESSDDNSLSNVDKDIHCLTSILERLSTRCSILESN